MYLMDFQWNSNGFPMNFKWTSNVIQLDFFLDFIKIPIAFAKISDRFPTDSNAFRNGFEMDLDFIRIPIAFA